MADSRHTDGFTFGGAAVYRIVVKGRLNSNASEVLGGMRVDASIDKDDPILTTLVGRLKDQAHLAGVLNTIYEMHLPVLEVKKLDE